MIISRKGVAVLISLVLIAGCTQNEVHTIEPVDQVYPYLDAANSRWFYFSSACRPFGMVNLSPDMAYDGAWDSGYRYELDSIKFFSHIHAWQLSGVPVMPTTGGFKGHMGPAAYQSSYSHANEKVFPGYHQVFLNDYDINVELTSTKRVGYHKYTFPASSQSRILLDLGTKLGPSRTKMGYVKKVSDREIQGFALMNKTRRRPKPTYVYFTIQMDKPFEFMHSWENDVLNNDVDEFEGVNGGVYMQYQTEENEQIQMKVGISYVSAVQAKKNIALELPHWDFEQVVSEARAEWNEMLGRIKVEGNTQKQRRRFYTDLWKSLQGRRIISDADGKYCDMTGENSRVGQIPLDENGGPEFNHYNSDSFWGAEWTITSLWQLVYPEIASEFIKSMLLMYIDGGMIPRGPSGGNYTHVMTGASATPFIVGAYMKGIQDFDVNMAYKGMRKNHMPGGAMGKAGYEHHTAKGGGIEHYIESGYVPYPIDTVRWGLHQDGAGQTLEYAYQDWCLAQLAKKLGKEEDYELLIQRSANWKNLFDTTTQWIRPKDIDGSWLTPFDPYAFRVGYVESNAAQATWHVPHDLQGLADLMGGADIAADKLNKSFQVASKEDFTSGKTHTKDKNASYWRIPINYGNQPSIHTAYIFNHLEKPWLTQYWSREVVDKVFTDLNPQRGYSGDEDQGLMGSLAVLMKLGLFEMKSGAQQNPMVDLGSPIFDRITIRLNNDYYSGDELEIVVLNNSTENKYVQQVLWDDDLVDGLQIPHALITQGGKLEFTMGSTPKKD